MAQPINSGGACPILYGEGSLIWIGRRGRRAHPIGSLRNVTCYQIRSLRMMPVGRGEDSMGPGRSVLTFSLFNVIAR